MPRWSLPQKSLEKSGIERHDTESPSQSATLRFINSAISPFCKNNGSSVSVRRRLSKRHGRPHWNVRTSNPANHIPETRHRTVQGRRPAVFRNASGQSLTESQTRPDQARPHSPPADNYQDQPEDRQFPGPNAGPRVRKHSDPASVSRLKTDAPIYEAAFHQVTPLSNSSESLPNKTVHAQSNKIAETWDSNLFQESHDDCWGCVSLVFVASHHFLKRGLFSATSPVAWSWQAVFAKFSEIVLYGAWFCSVHTFFESSGSGGQLDIPRTKRWHARGWATNVET